VEKDLIKGGRSAEKTQGTLREDLAKIEEQRKKVERKFMADESDGTISKPKSEQARDGGALDLDRKCVE